MDKVQSLRTGILVLPFQDTDIILRTRLNDLGKGYYFAGPYRICCRPEAFCIIQAKNLTANRLLMDKGEHAILAPFLIESWRYRNC
jgi:hypothetical protein